jgi:serine/threonine-protein kinase
VLARALAKRPEQRFGSGAAFVTALRIVARRNGIAPASSSQIAELVLPRAATVAVGRGQTPHGTDGIRPSPPANLARPAQPLVTHETPTRLAGEDTLRGAPLPPLATPPPRRPTGGISAPSLTANDTGQRAVGERRIDRRLLLGGVVGAVIIALLALAVSGAGLPGRRTVNTPAAEIRGTAAPPTRQPTATTAPTEAPTPEPPTALILPTAEQPTATVETPTPEPPTPEPPTPEPPTPEPPTPEPPTPEPATATATLTPTVELTATPTLEPTPSPTTDSVETETPTDQPTPTATTEPTAQTTAPAEPTAEPTAAPAGGTVTETTLPEVTATATPPPTDTATATATDTATSTATVTETPSGAP